VRARARARHADDAALIKAARNYFAIWCLAFPARRKIRDELIIPFVRTRARTRRAANHRQSSSSFGTAGSGRAIPIPPNERKINLHVIHI